MPKRVLCIMDLSLAGRAGMACALPVLAACGVQGCALPTTLLSTHLGGFGEVAALDTQAFCEDALTHLAQEKVAFDAIYTGYLLEDTDFALVQRAFDLYPQAVKIVDPVLGDNGKTYSKTTGRMVDAMRTLCGKADIITPNLTEARLLLGEEQVLDLSDWLRLLSRGHSSVVITSMPLEDKTGVLGVTKEGTVFSFASSLVPQSYPGTGDLFASALCGLVLSGLTVEQAAKRSARFVEAAAAKTYTGGGEPRQGVWFEECLHLLWEDACQP